MKLGYSLYWICLTALRLMLLHSILDWLSFKQSIKLLTISVRQRNLFDCDWRSLKMAESKSRIFAHFKITFERLKGNWRQIFLLFFVSIYSSYVKESKMGKFNDILCKTKFSTNLFWRLIDGHFGNGSIQVAWCDMSHMCTAVKSVMSRPESNKFFPAVQLLPKFTSGKKNKICSILI